MFQEKNAFYVTTSIVQSLGKIVQILIPLLFLVCIFSQQSFFPSKLSVSPSRFRKENNIKPIKLKLVTPFEPRESLVLHVRIERIQNY